MSLSMQDFLRRYSTIPNQFIDDMFRLVDEHTSQVDFAVDLNKVAKWLNVRKDNLMKTLVDSYKRGIDYVVKVPPKVHRHGGHMTKIVLLTPDCFKRLCMRSRSKKAEDVRTYFLQLEALVLKYKTQMMDGMKHEIARMERNQRPKDPADRAGFIYVIKASPTRDSVYKIGRTNNLARRLKEYQTGQDDEVEVVFRFRTDNLKATEACLKMLLKPKQLRKFREIYQVDVDIIKELVSGCDSMIGHVKLEHTANKPPTLMGGYYCVLCQ